MLCSPLAAPVLALAVAGCPGPTTEEIDAFRERRDAGPMEDDAFVSDIDTGGFDGSIDAFRVTMPDTALEPDVSFGPPSDAGPCGVVDF